MHGLKMTGSLARTAAIVLTLGVVGVAGARADLDPNASQEFPTDGYGVVICGNSHVEDGLIDNTIKTMLRQCYLTLTQTYGFDPNNVWILVDSGLNVDNWTQGLFDDLPATQAQVSSVFQTIGQRMWNDPSTPKNLMIIFGGHGARGLSSDPNSMRVQLADGLVWDYAFVSNCLNQINNNGYSSSPIERLDVIMTMCYSGGLIDDMRNNFHNLRGSTWPNAVHLSTLTAGDGFDITTGFLGVQLLNAIEGGITPTDFNGDGVFSIYEIFDCAAWHDFTNPSDANYTPYIPETIYVPSFYYMDFGYAEHPLYYEWNAPPAPVTLTLNIVNELWGSVSIDPPPDDANTLQFDTGTEVTLTAEPVEGREFRHWEIFDPNHAGDANHAVLDSNEALTLVLDTDREVTAVFKCGSGAGQALPLLVIGLSIFGFVMRRRSTRL
ncbi:MAG: hypothetical protein JXQ73_00910 [Phycisphaerae bacterium]|nr:hypothetical protein [Phycisphaerae bacterium]